MPPGVKRSFVDAEMPMFGAGVTRWKMLNIFLAESIGTGMLVFWGCMSVVIGLTSIEIGLMFGLVVGTIIQIFGHISLAHLNPAVTFAAVILGKINCFMAALYVLAELLGATLGYKLLLLITSGPMSKASCCTVINYAAGMSLTQGIVTEYFLTSILIFLLCSCWDARNATKGDSIALKFGFAISALATAGGPYTGASMNPARSFGPAVWDWNWESHWVYWLAPLAAGLSISAFYKYVLDRKVKEVYEVTPENIPLNVTQKRNESTA